MNTLFPFGFPFQTGFYLVLYELTLVTHVAFLNYVLAGTGYLSAVTMFRGGPKARHRGPIASVLRDWMPFALSGVITSAIAPLLFLQILWKDRFYTANLLLFHRFMAFLPVLIVAFYLLYIFKSRLIGGWPGWARILVGLGAFLSFVFTGLTLAENHLLGLHEDLWPDLYRTGTMVFFSPEMLPRLSLWFLGSIPTMCLIVAWQLWYTQKEGEQNSRPLAVLALVGIVLSACAGVVYYWYCGRIPLDPRLAPAGAVDPTLRLMFTGPLAGPYLYMACAALAVQAVAWVLQLRSRQFSAPILTLASVAVAVTLTGMTIVREALRLARMDISDYFGQHADAYKISGFPVFLVFLVVSVALCAWCVRLARIKAPQEQA